MFMTVSLSNKEDHMRYLTLLFFLLPLFLSAQDVEMLPYLQTPNATSMYVCWFGASGNESIVQYGTSPGLGLASTGDVHVFDDETLWHWVKLTNLSADTHYYYKCITGNQESSISSFTTPPNINTPGAHLRIIIIGDTQYEAPPVITNIDGMVTAIQSKMLELYGDDWKQKINLICHTGDIVEWTGLPDPTSPFIHQYFSPFSPFSASIPSMIDPGNHDYDGAGVYVIYDLLKAEEICGSEGEKYFSFNLANSKFIFLNTNGQPVGQGTTQLDWLDNQVSDADADNDIDFIFTIAHHYGQSEIVPEHYTAWTQNAVIPTLVNTTKPILLSNGHAHCYERGTHSTSRLRHVIGGGGGGDLDRWGHEDPVDYPETHIALDYWTYTLIDIDIANHHYDAKVFSLGNPDILLDNVLIDSWSQSTEPVFYQAITVSAKAPEGGQIKLVSAPITPYPGFDLMSSQVQVSQNSSFTSNIIDSSRNWEDIFENTGEPNYSPIDVNADIDLKRYTITDSSVQQGNTYFWRIRYRSQNTDWGEWSSPQPFVYEIFPVNADFVYSTVTAANIPVQFTDSSIGSPTSWSWDFNNDGTPESTLQDPVWTFSNQGLQHVSLSVMINGQLYSVTKDIQVGIYNSEQLSLPFVYNYQVYPNPSRGSTTISFELKKKSVTDIVIYNLHGQKIRFVSRKLLLPGIHRETWDGKTDKGQNAATGTYFIRICTEEGSCSQKFVLMR